MRRKSVSYAKYGYIFSIPFVLAYIIFSLYPTIYTAVIGFTDLRGLTKTDWKFLSKPFANFQQILKTPAFIESLQNTAIIWIINFIPQILLALLLTAWFTNHRRNIKGQGAFKVIFYMPNIITAATIAILFSSLFGYPVGPVNDLLQSLGISKESIYFLNEKWTAKLIVAFIQFWQWYGYTMLILISGVLGINPELFEAAEMDGASSSQSFFKITIPSLRTIMLYMLVTSMIGGLQMFDIPKLFIPNSGPDNATLTTSVFIYNQAFSGSYMYNRAAAASMIMFVIIAILSGVLFFSMRDRAAAKLRKAEKDRLKAYNQANKTATRRAEV